MKTRDPKWLALVSVVLIGFTLGCSVTRSPAKPSDIAREYMYYLCEGEFKAAAKLTSAQMSERWFGRNDLEEFKTAVKEDIKEQGGVKTIEIRREYIVGEAAKVELVIIFNNGQVDTSFFELVKEGGGWKIADQGAWGKPLPSY